MPLTVGLAIKLFFPPEIVIVPFLLMFLKSKKKITVGAAKSVFLTVHTYPSPEVFLRSMRKCCMRKWGGSFPEFFFF